MEGEPTAAEPPKVVEQTSPLTKEEFVNQMNALIEHAKSAGLQPLQLMAGIYLKQSRGVLNRFFDTLENG